MASKNIKSKQKTNNGMSDIQKILELFVEPPSFRVIHFIASILNIFACIITVHSYLNHAYAVTVASIITIAVIVVALLFTSYYQDRGKLSLETWRKAFHSYYATKFEYELNLKQQINSGECKLKACIFLKALLNFLETIKAYAVIDGREDLKELIDEEIQSLKKELNRIS